MKFSIYTVTEKQNREVLWKFFGVCLFPFSLWNDLLSTASFLHSSFPKWIWKQFWQNNKNIDNKNSNNDNNNDLKQCKDDDNNNQPRKIYRDTNV